MAPNVRDQVVADEISVSRPRTDISSLHKPEERRVFQTFEGTGSRGDESQLKQQMAIIVVAVVICSVLYGLLYLAMHFQE